MESKLEEDVEFIKSDLLPEMVHNRCFCDVGSREFVEFQSADVQLVETPSYQLNYSLFRASVIIEFSSIPKIFNILIKLLPDNALFSDDPSLTLACDGLLNEEILCNKGRLQYGDDFFPKFYVADMGKYGRPVVVIEDLEKCGYQRVLDRKLNEEEGKKVVDLIGRFHGRGLLLKQTKFSVFREFYAKFQEITFAKCNESKHQTSFSGFLDELKASVSNEDAKLNMEKVFDTNIYETFKKSTLESISVKSSTICQGLLFRENLWFKRNDLGNLELRIQDWQFVRYGSNSLDLATILTQCNVDKWNDLIDAYIESVQKELSAITAEELRQDLSCTGFYYAFFILSLQSRRPSDIANILKFFLR